MSLFSNIKSLVSSLPKSGSNPKVTKVASSGSSPLEKLKGHSKAAKEFLKDGREILDDWDFFYTNRRVDSQCFSPDSESVINEALKRSK